MLRCALVFSAALLCCCAAVAVTNKRSFDAEEVTKTAVSRDEGPQLRRSEDVAKGVLMDCQFCVSAVGYMFRYLRRRPDTSINGLAGILKDMCYRQIYKDKSVCNQLIENEKAQLQYIVKHGNATAQQACALWFSSSVDLGESCGLFKGEPWEVELPAPLPPRDEGDGEESTSPHRIQKVLHLTDIHHDPRYVEGSSVVCEASSCCTEDSGPPPHPSLAAGRWGSYHDCDAPTALVDNLLGHISATHKDIDYIIWTGDSVAHDIWRFSQINSKEVVKDMTRRIKKHFPNTEVYSSIGNHESVPRESFPPHEIRRVREAFGLDWLYEFITNQWQTLTTKKIPNSSYESASFNIKVGENFRIISLNTNYCYKFNFWLLYKQEDPGLVLQWLVRQLSSAEVEGDRVHIIGHVAPHHADCYEQWAHQFSRVYTRFSDTIRGMFFGHDHRDDLRLLYSVDAPSEAIGVEYLTPNNGVWGSYNPTYRIYHIDGDYPGTTRKVLDHETYWFNLTEANLPGEYPQWKLLYRATEDLPLPDLEPKSWETFAKKLKSDQNLALKWWRYRAQASDFWLQEGCDEKCRLKTYKDMVESNVNPHDQRE